MIEGNGFGDWLEATTPGIRRKGVTVDKGVNIDMGFGHCDYAWRLIEFFSS